MGKLNIFKIELSQPRGVFYGGQWLQGYVCVELNAPMKMRGIRLTFYGGGKVSYVETTTQSTSGSGRSTHQRKDRTMYRSIEEYFNHTMYVFGAPDPSFLATNSPTLAAGRYHYPFQFLLPSWIPSSFEGAHGHVRYSLKAVIDKPWKFDHETRKLFTVVGMMDLNKVEDAPNPGEIQGEKTICCLCCASGPVGANLRVERRGFVPGENIFISGDVINNSSRRMKWVKIVIAQKVGFHAIECSRLQPTTGHRHGGRSAARRHRVWAPCSHTKWSESEIVAINKGELAAGETLTLNQDALKVPPVPPSFLNGCGVIDIQYFLKAVLNPAGPSRKLEVPLKITIGTIPLRSLFPEYNEAARRAGHTTGHILPQLPSAPPEGTASNYPPPDAPPPYFAESYEGRKQVKDEGQSEYLHGDTEWAPVYPYYDFHNTPAFGGATTSSSHGPPQSLPQTMQVPTIGFQPPTPEAESVSTGTAST